MYIYIYIYTCLCVCVMLIAYSAICKNLLFLVVLFSFCHNLIIHIFLRFVVLILRLVLIHPTILLRLVLAPVMYSNDSDYSHHSDYSKNLIIPSRCPCFSSVSFFVPNYSLLTILIFHAILLPSISQTVVGRFITATPPLEVPCRQGAHRSWPATHDGSRHSLEGLCGFRVWGLGFGA